MKKMKQTLALLLVAIPLFLATLIDTDRVSLTDNGNNYELVQEGDLLPKLFVNHKLVPREKWAHYKTVLDKLNVLLDQKHHYKKSADSQ